jgi:hypothetical protein
MALASLAVIRATAPDVYDQALRFPLSWPRWAGTVFLLGLVAFIALEEVAGRAGVSVQTVIRRFGGKQGLRAAAAQRESERVRSRRTGGADLAGGRVRLGVPIPRLRERG